MRAAILLILLSACSHVPPPPPEGSTCQSACERAEQLQCPWSKGTPNGVSCIELCEHTRDVFPYDLACMTKAMSCAEIDTCNREPQP